MKSPRRDRRTERALIRTEGRRSVLLIPALALLLATGLSAQDRAAQVVEMDEIRAAAADGLGLVELIRRALPEVRLRSLAPGAGGDPGPAAPWDCVEYGVQAGDSCRNLEVVLDGVVTSDAPGVLRSLELASVERLEALSPEGAADRYGTFGETGVLLVGTLPVSASRPGAARAFAGADTGESYPWARVLTRAFIANALTVGLTYAPVDYCTEAWDGSLQIRKLRDSEGRREALRCNDVVAVGAGFLALATPIPATAFMARRAGTSPTSRGSLLSLTMGALTHLSGHLLFFQGRATDSGVMTGAGATLLAFGTPLVVTVTDRFSRRPR